MGASNSLVATLLAMAGQRNVITIPRAFVRFTGNLESAMLLNQLLYWMPRSHLDGDSIYKTDAEWQEELCLTRYAVRQARDCLVKMGFLTTSVHHQKGTPAVHYHIDYELLVEKWEVWLQGEGVKFENERYSPPSKVRKRTLPDESNSNPDGVKFESRQTMNHRVPTEIHGDDDDCVRDEKTINPEFVRQLCMRRAQGVPMNRKSAENIARRVLAGQSDEATILTSLDVLIAADSGMGAIVDLLNSDTTIPPKGKPYVKPEQPRSDHAPDRSRRPVNNPKRDPDRDAEFAAQLAELEQLAAKRGSDVSPL
jgi:hypothetical protein